MRNKIGIGEAALYLGQTTKTLQRWDEDKTLQAHKTKGGTRYYSQTDLDVMKHLLSGVTRRRAAEQLNVSEKTLWRWHRNGRFKAKYIIGNTWYYQQNDIDRYLQHNKKGI